MNYRLHSKKGSAFPGISDWEVKSTLKHVSEVADCSKSDTCGFSFNLFDASDYYKVF